MIGKHYLASVLALFLAGCATNKTVSDGSDNTIAIEINDQVTGTVNDLLFGQFFEMLSPGREGEGGPEAAMTPELREDVRALLEQMYLPVLRYPGGGMLEAPRFRWTQLISNAPVEEKDQRKFKMGLHEFLNLCEELDAEPLLVVKLADMVREIRDPAQVLSDAAAMVAYVNAPADADVPTELKQWVDLRIANGRKEPWDVKLWQIGNEFAWAGVGWLENNKGMSKEQIADAYVDAVAKIHSAMKAVDPTIEFLAEIDMEQERLQVFVADKLANRLGDELHHMTAHKYFSWGIDRLEYKGEPRKAEDMSHQDFWYAVASASPETDQLGQSEFDVPMLHSANDLGYPLAVTEWNWNSWWGIETPDNFDNPATLWAKGMGAASMLHGLMNAPGEISLATQSMLMGDYWDIRTIDISDDAAHYHPSGQVTSLYGFHHGNERLGWAPISDFPAYKQNWTVGQLTPNDNVAYVDIVVTRSKDSVYLHLLNRYYDQPVTVVVDTAAVVEDDSAHGTIYQLLDGGNGNAAKEASSPVGRTKGEPWEITIPAASVNVVKIPIQSS